MLQGMSATRRQFVVRAVLGAGAALLAAGGRPARAGQTDAVLLSCMDYRLIDDTVAYMTARGMADKYDHLVLAGASLGALTDQKPAWGDTFWQHLQVAIDLHGVHRIIVMDHRDCGAYKLLLGEDFAADPLREADVHRTQMLALRKAIRHRYPDFNVELLLMSLDGSVIEVPIEIN